MESVMPVEAHRVLAKARASTDGGQFIFAEQISTIPKIGQPTGQVFRAAALFNHRLESGEKGRGRAYTGNICESTSGAPNTGDCRVLLH